jgi:predicted nucleic acid-binding protein
VPFFSPVLSCVANTSPLIAFSAIGRLDLLRAIFPTVFVPDAVFGEVVINGVGWVEAKNLQVELAGTNWLVRTEVPASPMLAELRQSLGGSGEAEAIVLAKERGLPVLLDELAGRRAATALGLQVIGSLRILRQSKEAGLVSRIRPLVGQMIEAGIYYSDDLMENFFREVGEL